jgi:hypothetical protein
VTSTKIRSLLIRPALLGAILAAVLGTTLLGCGQTGAAVADGPPPDAPGRIDAQVGDTVERDGVTITVLQLAAAEELVSRGGSSAYETDQGKRKSGAFVMREIGWWGDGGRAAQDGHFFITLQIRVLNTGTTELDQGAEALVLELRDGSRKLGSRRGFAPLLASGGPAPGTDSEAGWRTWEVPNGTRAATLSYRPRPDLEIRYAIFPSAPSASLRPGDLP